ncbi:MAG: hypothetical protein JWR61_4582 [Ferruginibacter sp.]|uniref:hypothetical protein n=1 Tax=Ferruginibacter sp. TaxID=1940288 RepID=UPI00265A2C48|nr:hypothetical protein [Ferruginibacter sp.]MDB5279627.1 hypothetical protein [Ferruginibacter sp.]
MSISKMLNGVHFLGVIHSSMSREQVKKLLFIFLSVAGGVLIGPIASAQPCNFVGRPQFGGIEPPMVVDASCVDPDYNDKTMVIDSTNEKSLKLTDGSTIFYTEVWGHFPALRTQAQLPAGILQSPTTAKHSFFWRFPEKRVWRNRFFQQTYPLAFEVLNTLNNEFAFTNGGYTVSVVPGNPNVGYRVIAAAAKLAKVYANKFYNNKSRIYGYIFGQSGGSVQAMGANEGTTGVWDGIVPAVIAVDGLNSHSFMWDGLYALAIPEEKRQAIAKAVKPGSGRDIYATLTTEQRDVLDELLNGGFARVALEDMKFDVGSANQGGPRSFDSTYEDDFWSKPGYEGTNPPAYLTAAKVDGYATITAIMWDAKHTPTGVTFEAATMPALGSIGTSGLQFYVYSSDTKTRITSGNGYALNGKLEGNMLTLTGANDSLLLGALAPGVKIRINNRYLLAVAFYPRHSILDNGSPAYNQYRNADGTPKYVQRTIQTAYLGNIRASGGRRETGHLTVKTIVIENLSDPSSFPYVGGFYASQVRQAMGVSQTDNMFRIYYQQNANHGAYPFTLPPFNYRANLVSVGGILHQVLLDLIEWVEHGVAPLSSTRYRTDAMNQIVLPAKAAKRGGHQPVLRLTVNGGDRVEVGINQPVNLVGRIEMPPGAGYIKKYDWYLGGSDFKFEPATTLVKPQTLVNVKRTVSFPAPGEYIITLRTSGQRDSKTDAPGLTLENLERVTIIVR